MHRSKLATGIQFEAKRTGLARILFAILHPRHAKAASVNAEAVQLVFGSRSTDIPLGNVETVDVVSGILHSCVRIRYTAGNSHVSGLPRAAACALADALETARCEWWHRTLAPRLEMLRSVHERLAALADPPKYLTADGLRDLEAEAKTVAGGFTARWPEALSDAPEIRMLREILGFLEAPGEARATASEAFVVNELVRSRELFDRIEARPLTEEQRRAVVIDEQRNLVVAAAGSGKTSVIVAKTGWLVRKGYRRPSELLLLAFARDARKEMEERIDRRLGTAVARDVTVRTFHGLGMAIIGEAEGKRPTLAATAENDRTLFDLLKGIVADLLADDELSGTLHEWFREEFAPYRSEHGFRNWSEYHDYIRKFDIRTLKGETVRSFEECEIANFLYLNGVAYEYEAPYEHDLATSQKRQYKPDFHLPEYRIYIEHFGIDAEGNTAPFVDREQYRQEMEWKRGVHAEHGTVLVETFSHEQADGRLHRNLTEKLTAHGVTLSLIPREDVFAALEQQGRIDPFTRLVATFLRTFGRAALIQRCQVHKGRNIVERLDESLHAGVKKVLRQVWEQDDAAKAEKLLRNLARRLEHDAPGVSGSILEGLDEILTVIRLGLPLELRRSLACTNAIENAIGTVRRVQRNVKRWRNAEMALRWTAAGLLEAQKTFRRLKAYRQLPILDAALREAVRKAGANAAIEDIEEAA